ncbi:MAG: hypothetical protein HZB38_02355 [Planctomycetes bacterium]|nr:hypothetical protein [Planctomycetota bacterium]
MALSLLASILVMMLQTAPAPADPNDPQPATRGAKVGRFFELQKKAREVIESAMQLGDWNEQAALSRAEIEKVFDRQGWNSEEDMFAFELIRAVDAKPPWAFVERAQTAFELLGDRYQLDEEQRVRMKELFVREAMTVFSTHGDNILTYAGEMIRTRVAGEPFSPEQIARWTKLAEPVMDFAHERFQKAIVEYMEDLSPEQRQKVARDLHAADRRFETVRELTQDWKAGNWSPSDWGMEEDPIQAGKVLQAREQAENDAAAGVAREQTGAPAEQPDDGEPPPSESKKAAPPTAQPPEAPPAAAKTPAKPVRAVGDPDPWARYVQAFIEKYKLDENQTQKAWVCYDQAKPRVEQANRRQLERNSDEARIRTELERVLAQLKQRLERLPTRAQRKAASPDEIPSPIELAKKPISTQPRQAR